MNKITCSFENEAQLHEHILEPTSNEQVSISTISHERLRVFEQVAIQVKVDDINASNQLKGRVIRRKPLSKNDEKKAWQYTVRLDVQDKVWFEAFIDEVDALSKIFSMPL